MRREVGESTLGLRGDRGICHGTEMIQDGWVWESAGKEARPHG
jgi:hypothetical protein